MVNVTRIAVRGVLIRSVTAWVIIVALAGCSSPSPASQHPQVATATNPDSKSAYGS